VGAATAAVARRLLAEGRSAVIEGVHVLPGEPEAHLGTDEGGAGGRDGALVELLLTLGDEELHRGHLTRRMHDEPARTARARCDASP